MKAVAAFLSAAVLALASCDYTRPPEDFAPNDDVVTIGVVLMAGQSHAHLLATHPHRKPRSGQRAPADVVATLSGPDWNATFAANAPLAHCNVAIPEQWSPAVCLRAALPGPIREGASYALAGTTAQGGFKGETTVPPAPVVHEPEDTLRISVAHSQDPVALDIRFDVPAPVHAVTVDATNAIQLSDDGTTKPGWIGTFTPRVLGIDAPSQRVLAWGPWPRPGLRFDVRLLGFETNYSKFVDRTRDNLLPKPWPDFGLEGDHGVYGYFGAGARSAGKVSVVVAVGGSS